MHLHEFFDAGAIALDLPASDRESVLPAVVALLGLDARHADQLLRLLQRREQLGSTGVGRGVAIPHCRSLTVGRLRVAYARLHAPVEFDAIDHQPVRHVFLIVAPPLEVSNQYLPVLGRIAQLVKDAEALRRLESAATPADVLTVLRERGG